MNFSHENYKLSRYNVFQQNDKNLYVWNTFSDALLKVDEKETFEDKIMRMLKSEVVDIA